MRVEISYHSHLQDGKAGRVLASLDGPVRQAVRALRVADVYLIHGLPESDKDSDDRILRLFADPVSQTAFTGGELLSSVWIREALPRWDLAIEIRFKAGVTDPVAISASEAIALEYDLPPGGAPRVQTARLFLLECQESTSLSSVEQQILPLLHNPLIQQKVVLHRSDFEAGNRFPLEYPGVAVTEVPAVIEYDIARMSDSRLLELSRERLLALSLEEMASIRDWFQQPEFLAEREARGLGAKITDVELEMLAQTWSEHCKHKIFQAHIAYDDADGTRKNIEGLFRQYIRRTTEDLAPSRPDLRSVFHDNSGVVDFDDEYVICFKAETHNSPSALDPYGGAITGIVGVNRDIMGTGKGARPIFNTNVLCFGPPDIHDEEIPKGLLHPRRVLAGVHEGIVDGGNQSGIPTVGGAFLFDESYLGKPLVFCGTGGLMPRTILGEESWIQHVDAGDLAVMVGGRVGKDGIHGATFSSLALDEDSPLSAVQIGDPITQRKMMDFLLEARDRGLYKGITDNGAGGLSSSLGEMAGLSHGIRVHLDRAPLKYPGLAPWEIWVSESQERMSLSVDPHKLDELLELASRRGVEATVLGEFTDSGNVELFYEGKVLGYLPLEFLEDGLPTMKLKARWIPPEARRSRTEAAEYREHMRTRWNEGAFLRSRILELLSEPNIRSKEEFVRQYDHEVQGRSVVKPFTGIKADGPSDGAVLRLRHDSPRGVTVTHGICPRMGDEDSYEMAAHAVDEAYRAHIALGGHPDKASALDNFCWPDPVESESTPDGAYKLAQLIRANEGLRDACLAYNLPLISGKDSMKNDANLGGRKVSVRPTLLVSLMGICPDLGTVPGDYFSREGERLYLLGRPESRLGGSYFEKLESRQLGEAPKISLKENRRRYELLHELIGMQLISSIHDISDGGLAVALAECAISGRRGADLDLQPLLDSAARQRNDEVSLAEILFAEGGGRFLLTVADDRETELESRFAKEELVFLGTIGGRDITLRLGAELLMNLELEQARASFQTAWRGVH